MLKWDFFDQAMLSVRNKLPRQISAGSHTYCKYLPLVEKPAACSLLLISHRTSLFNFTHTCFSEKTVTPNTT